MTRRRAPRWQVEATAWSGGLVLILGLSALSLGVVAPVDSRATETIQTPVVEQVRETTVRVPTITKVPSGNTKKFLTIGPSVLEILGPPPGPVADVAPARVAAPEDRYAFLIGITAYRAPTHETIGGANDVRAIASVLEQQGWLTRNIKVVTDGDATAAALRNGMAWLASKGQNGKTFSLFHYSGHVMQQGGTTEALWPVDEDYVPDVEVAAALSRVKGKVWVDIAGCEAGSFIPGLPTSDVLVTASSMQTEKSYEYPPWQMSVWSGLLFMLGTQQGGADADGNGVVTIGEALRYATYYAQAITLYQQPYGRQTPQSAGDPVRGWTLSAPPA